jgi:hypothetical protein
MSDRARKLEKKRKKREQKRHQLRKIKSVSPVKRAAAGRLVACVMNADWRERGQACPYILREGPGGRYVMATFMIDLWCAGLKDAWGRVDVLRDKFDQMIAHTDEQMDGTMEDISIDEVAEVVAGSVRFARQNGFKLPKDWQKWTALVDPDLDFEKADLSDFGKDGGLLWVGPTSDLRRRLIGSTVAEFFARPDVHYIAEPDAEDYAGLNSDEALPEEEYGPLARPEVRKALERTVTSLHDALLAWCETTGDQPSSTLGWALSCYVTRVMVAGSRSDGRQSPAEALATILDEMAREAREAGGPPEADNIRAVAQLKRFIEATKVKADAEDAGAAAPEASPRETLVLNVFNVGRDAAAPATQSAPVPVPDASK